MESSATVSLSTQFECVVVKIHMWKLILLNFRKKPGTPWWCLRSLISRICICVVTPAQFHWDSSDRLPSLSLAFQTVLRNQTEQVFKHEATTAVFRQNDVLPGNNQNWGIKTKNQASTTLCWQGTSTAKLNCVLQQLSWCEYLYFKSPVFEHVWSNTEPVCWSL